MAERTRISLYSLKFPDLYGKALKRGESVDVHLLKAEEGFFDVDDYSRFKFGDSDIAQQYGRALAAKFKRQCKNIVFSGSGIAIISPPYVVIPTASYACSLALQQAINEERTSPGLEPATNVHVRRSEATIADYDYAFLTKADREREVQKMKFSLEPQLIRGKHVLVVDDVLITGTAEKVLADFLEPFEKLSISYLYVAMVHQGQATLDPAIEGRMNLASVRSLQDLVEISRRTTLSLNLKMCRFILEWGNTEELRAFFNARDLEFLENMYSGIVHTGKKLLDRCPDSIQLLREILHEKRQACLRQSFSVFRSREHKPKRLLRTGSKLAHLGRHIGDGEPLHQC